MSTSPAEPVKVGIGPAMDALVAGKKVRRSGASAYYLDVEGIICLVTPKSGINPAGIALNPSIRWEDVKAVDWVIED
jgi:hypothetical protein